MLKFKAIDIPFELRQLEWLCKRHAFLSTVLTTLGIQIFSQ